MIIHSLKIKRKLNLIAKYAGCFFDLHIQNRYNPRLLFNQQKEQSWLNITN
ncbi:hypothetical protein HMPREF0476_1065 [Kingella kingae ATCC 23330]|uniref:Uncharacterized protein n=1 Tax=Kingella kingae ATCC 23330 TaxID=887327 RepID=F5S782_KINKI|nr:hypothetical protein HMPREF0476_1065 [Kingella kingae ATCC 23330]